MDEETRALLATMVGGEQECDEMFGNLQQLETGVEQLNNLLDSAPPSALGTENFSSLFVTTAADMRIILFMIANNLEAMRHYDTSQPNPTLVEQAAKLYAPLAHKLGLYQVKTELEDLSLKYSEHVLITAPYEVSVQRICERDGITPEMARRRLDAQMPLEVLRAHANYELINDGAPEELFSKSAALLHTLEQEAYGKE